MEGKIINHSVETPIIDSVYSVSGEVARLELCRTCTVMRFCKIILGQSAMRSQEYKEFSRMQIECNIMVHAPILFREFLFSFTGSFQLRCAL